MEKYPNQALCRSAGVSGVATGNGGDDAPWRPRNLENNENRTQKEETKLPKIGTIPVPILWKH